MVTRFGSREICDVTFKATTNNQRVGNKSFKAGQPVFIIDTATASNMEQATTTVYAQGGKGYNRLIAWEGEKTLTFTVTDALMSPLGLAVLTGAGFANEGAVKHIHTTFDVSLDANGKGSITCEALANELGLPVDKTIEVCNDTQLRPYATILDHNGAIVGWADEVELSGQASTTLENIINVDATNPLEVTVLTATNKTIKLDFYIRMTTGATEITIAPGDFGGFFYVEADTLYRNQDGKDMAATLTFPKVKVQSGFTLSMAPTGDPSTFDFVMDAFPAYTYFDHTKKVVCDITIVSGDDAQDAGVEHSHPVEHNPIEPPTPTPDPTTAIAPKAADATIFGHTVSDLQDGIVIGADNKITGTLNEVTIGELPSYWVGYTHFLALDFTPDEGIAPEDVKVGINGLVTLDADLDGAFAINNDSLVKGFKVVTTKDGIEYEKTYDLSGLTLA